MQFKVRNAKYIRINPRHRNGPLSMSNFYVRGQSESAVIAHLRQINRGYDIIIVSIDWG